MKKDAKLLIRLKQEEKEKFRKICQEQEENMQRVVRSFIKAYIEKFDNN